MKQDPFLKWLLSTIKCGVCGRSYEAGDVEVLGQQEEFWFISVFCPACGTHGLVAAVVKQGSPAEVITDLSDEEFAKFAHREAIKSDDVLDMYDFLKGFKGDIPKLLSQDK